MSERRGWRNKTLPAMGLLLIGLFWGVGVWVLGVPEYIMPSPWLVAATLGRDFGTIMNNVVPTAVESLAGFLIGNLASILIATVFVHQKTVQDAFFPIVILIRSIPIVAIAPILVLMFGNDMTPKIAIAALICFFPTLVNMVKGLQSVNPQALELMRLLSASNSEIFWKLRIQSSLPYLFAALKIAASASVIGAIVGEWIGSTAGLGALIIQATYNFDTGLLYATVVVAAMLSVTFTALVGWIEKRVVRWEAGAA